MGMYDQGKKQDDEGYVTLPLGPYFMIPGTDIAIHVKSFEFVIIFTFISTSIAWAIGLWTNWYGIMLNQISAFAYEIKYELILFGLIVFVIMVAYFGINHHLAKKKATQK